MENTPLRFGGEPVIDRALIAAAPFAKAFVGFTAFSVLAQALPVDPTTFAGEIVKLGPVGMLMTGCIVLWRMLWALDAQHKVAAALAEAAHNVELREKDEHIQRKDDQILSMAKATTEALVTMTNTATELRAAVTKGQEELLKEVRHRQGH